MYNTLLIIPPCLGALQILIAPLLVWFLGNSGWNLFEVRPPNFKDELMLIINKGHFTKMYVNLLKG